MNLSMKWLNEFTPVNMPIRAFAEAMTMSGSKVEGFETEGAKIENVVVGKILSIEKHPEADKLVVCQVDVGEDAPLQIVTGATNLKQNDLVPVAKDHSVLADGTKIKKGKLRGVLSCGMLCSLGELGLTTHDFPYAIEDGIFVLQEDCSIGQDIKSAIGLDDIKVEFEITSNRPDCFSVIGLAREAAATFDQPLQLHTPVVKAGHGDCRDMLQVNIAAADLCYVYSARVVKNVRVKPSPRWMRARLRAMGVRPINNIVDITNYVMLEYGQPMHAFDLRYIEGGKIQVRRAKNGETITTLDGVDRTLTDNNLVIADACKPVAIAGVMGGEYSGIMDDTTTIVFESATFLGSSVRLTAKQHGMRTDASSRYEKGLDPNACLPALERACELVELLDAGDVMDGVVADSCFEPAQRTIAFDPAWINRFLATDITSGQMQKILEKTGCKIIGENIVVPTFRPDLVHKADIAEEIARFYGYNQIASTALSGGAQGKYSERQKFDMRITASMLAMGLSEIMTYSFISPKYYNKVLMPENHPLRNSVVISNPLGEDSSIMRTTALPSMLEILAKNYSNRNTAAHLFELAKEYIPTAPDKLPLEKNTLIAGFYGDCDFFSAKGILEALLAKLGVSDYDIQAADDRFGYHPGRCAVLTINGQELGIIGEIHPECVKNYGIGTRVYVFSLDADVMYAHANQEKHYTPLPKYPAVTRDLAVICDEGIPVLTLEKAITAAAGKHLDSLSLFDVYQGKQIEAGKKSVAFNIALRSADSTLTDEQASVLMDKIIKALEKSGAVLRA
ncbi:MAG TPA: phenylalanine--tRNA ligase subunit beta [Candidatus Scatavimonas merdigallinarum]|uniref:Phenylalanine--tRNA ligase beta subunit n=1 Tax=Candidatus Scatavimonas merdigallinarum TaxID=2840914 RepID=A0A9D1CU89_9FIRM|nr:phenylalanine--tRNA ligase subunit beta [Candidatus Scatavimonas merdigallinarum]